MHLKRRHWPAPLRGWSVVERESQQGAASDGERTDRERRTVVRAGALRGLGVHGALERGPREQIATGEGQLPIARPARSKHRAGKLDGRGYFSHAGIPGLARDISIEGQRGRIVVGHATRLLIERNGTVDGFLTGLGALDLTLVRDQASVPAAVV